MRLTRQEEDDDDRVDDGEPVDLYVTHVKVRVPPGRPLYSAFLPCHLICKRDTGWTCNKRQRLSNKQVSTSVIIITSCLDTTIETKC